MGKKRLDLLLVERGLAESRERAKALIISGKVFEGTRRLEKAGMLVDSYIELEVKGKDHPYVSRGGVKLEAALKKFGIDPTGLNAIDIGASTGGFTDCLLQAGAKSVTAIDVGRGQIDWKLRSDTRVKLIENFNAREISTEKVGGPFDISVIDVSFISLELILPGTLKVVSPGGTIIALVKPQFEAGREEVGKGGIIKDSAVHEKVVDKIIAFGKSLRLELVGKMESPITGAKGNKEFFVLFKKTAS